MTEKLKKNSKDEIAQNVHARDIMKGTDQCSLLIIQQRSKTDIRD